MENISHVIDIHFNLIFRIFPILKNAEDRPLKPIRKVKYGLTVDVFKQGFLRVNTGTTHRKPPCGEVLVGKNRSQIRGGGAKRNATAGEYPYPEG
jgi:hypothetical protein